jgi:hypothetical protein
VLAATGGDPPDDPVVDGDVFGSISSPDPAKAAGSTPSSRATKSARGKDSHRSDAALPRERIGRACRGDRAAIRGLARLWLPYILVDDVPGTLASRRSCRRARHHRSAHGSSSAGKPRGHRRSNGGIVGIVNWP